MGFGMSSIIAFPILFVTFPSSSLGGLRSWICGTCTVCQLCPTCEPHLNISPICECHENLNNCNCNCVSHERLQQYHHERNLQLRANLHNNHAAQMNSDHFKRHLLLWLVGLSFFNIITLLFIIVLIFFAPALLQRCIRWKSHSKLHRREQFMKKHHLVVQPPISRIEPLPQSSLSALQPISTTSMISMQPSSDNLLQQLDAHKEMVHSLTRDLQAAHTHSPVVASVPSRKIT